MSVEERRPQTVVILAAGVGMRLRPLTHSVPKAMVSCAGWPLLSYSIRFAKEVLGDDGLLVVVVGYRGEMVSNLIEAEAPGAVIAWNHDYLKGNLLSVEAGLPHVRGDLLLMNVDHIYPWAFAKRLMASPGRIVAAVDRDRPLGPDDMKVGLDTEGRLLTISKVLEGPDAGYIGMTLVRQEAMAAYRRSCHEARRKKEDAAVAEDVLQVLADSGEDVTTCDLSGLGWIEIDTLEELEAAESRLMEDEGFFERSW